MPAFSGTQLAHKTRPCVPSVSQKMLLCEYKMDIYAKHEKLLKLKGPITVSLGQQTISKIMRCHVHVWFIG
jgi:hypothetical protein